MEKNTYKYEVKENGNLVTIKLEDDRYEIRTETDVYGNVISKEIYFGCIGNPKYDEAKISDIKYKYNYNKDRRLSEYIALQPIGEKIKYEYIGNKTIKHIDKTKQMIREDRKKYIEYDEAYISLAKDIKTYNESKEVISRVIEIEGNNPDEKIQICMSPIGQQYMTVTTKSKTNKTLLKTAYQIKYAEAHEYDEEDNETSKTTVINEINSNPSYHKSATTNVYDESEKLIKTEYERFKENAENINMNKIVINSDNTISYLNDMNEFECFNIQRNHLKNQNAGVKKYHTVFDNKTGLKFNKLNSYKNLEEREISKDKLEEFAKAANIKYVIKDEFLFKGKPIIQKNKKLFAGQSTSILWENHKANLLKDTEEKLRKCKESKLLTEPIDLKQRINNALDSIWKDFKIEFIDHTEFPNVGRLYKVKEGITINQLRKFMSVTSIGYDNDDIDYVPLSKSITDISKLSLEERHNMFMKNTDELENK